MTIDARYLPHYTYDDYVCWEGRWEVIHGIPYAMSPAPNLRHQRVSGNIAVQLEEALENCGACRAYLPVDWMIADDIVVQPDNLVVCEEVSGKYLTVPPVLIFEVLSPSTASKDRNLKFHLYREAGVRYYALVDPEAERVEVFALDSDAYVRIADTHDDAVPFALGPCRIDVDFARLWR